MNESVFQEITEKDLEKFEECDSGVAIYNRDGDIVYANRQALLIFGYASVEDLPNGWNFIPPEYRPIVRRRIEKALAGEISPALTLKIFTGDRRIEIVRSMTYPVIFNGEKAIMAVFSREMEDRFKRLSMEEASRIIRRSIEPFLENRVVDVREILDGLYESVKKIFSSVDLVFVRKDLKVLFATTDKVPCKEDPPILKCINDGKEIYISSNEIDGKVYTVFASPVIVGGEIFGAIGFRREGYGSFAPEDVEVLRTASEIVSLVLGLSKKMEEIENKNADLFKNLMLDGLTGAYTRNYLSEFVEKLVLYSRRKGDDVSVVMMDIDNLKLVNDNHGHLEGDNLLRDFSRIVMKNIRSTDFFIRFGGDEFLLILPGSDEDSAKAIMDRILKEVERVNADREPKILFSYGIASVRDDLKEAIRLADERMYEMKRLHHRDGCF